MHKSFGGLIKPIKIHIYKRAAKSNTVLGRGNMREQMKYWISDKKTMHEMEKMKENLNCENWWKSSKVQERIEFKYCLGYQFGKLC